MKSGKGRKCKTSTAVLLFLVFIVQAFPCLRCQERIETSQFGTFVHGGLNIHTANFQTLPGVPSCCPRYENGTGAGFAIGGFYDFITESPLSFQVRLGYSTLGATLKTDEFTTVLVNGNSTPGEFEHSVTAAIGLLSVTPLAKYKLIPQVALVAGPSVGWILSNTFREKETMIQPVSVGTFENGLRVRNAYAGPTPGASNLYVGFTVGMQYRLPLNTANNLFAIPEVFGTYGVTPLVSGMNWRASSIAGGISFEYRLFAPLPPPAQPPVPRPPPPLAPAVKPMPPSLTATLAVATLDSTNQERPLKELVIEDYIRTQYRPLLNYIFFDSGSALLPARYHRISRSMTSAYDFRKFSDYETLPLYYEVLNIIGKRMKEYPRAMLTIVGCSGTSSENDGDRALARKRAEIIYRYLHDVWAIDSQRVRLEWRGLPQKPSNPDDSDGQAENRRAEIYCDAPQVLEPIFTTDTAHIPKPAVIRFLPGGTSQAGMSQWAIGTSEGEVKIKDFSGKGGLTEHLDWNLEKEHEQNLATLDTIQAVLEVEDTLGRSAESNVVSVPVRHYTLLDKHRVGSTDTIISRYSLILFDFDRSVLGEANRRIADFVKARISSKSVVRILGYTDRTGTDVYNQKLSGERAQATERYIGIHGAEVRGFGRSALLYDNSLPEGRFYSRTVSVIVTTPTTR